VSERGANRAERVEQRPVYPLSAVVGQEALVLALVLAAVDRGIGGVLLRGQKGSAKTTAARGLASVLPGRAPFVELPVGASEDRVVGTVDLKAVLRDGEGRFSPGLLAAADGGVLYVDEVNLLDDHIVDVLLDAAAMGVNVVEREGISVWHPSRFILVGTMNPEEGDLRPQLLDRFGLCVDVTGISNVADRVEIVQRREQFEADSEGFSAAFAESEEEERLRIERAMVALPEVEVARPVLEAIARLSIALEVDGHRADLVARKAAQALAALHGLPRAGISEVAAVAPMVLAHRVRTQPGQRPHDVAEVARRILGES